MHGSVRNTIIYLRFVVVAENGLLLQSPPPADQKDSVMCQRQCVHYPSYVDGGTAKPQQHLCRVCVFALVLVLDPVLNL